RWSGGIAAPAPRTAIEDERLRLTVVEYGRKGLIASRYGARRKPDGSRLVSRDRCSGINQEEGVLKRVWILRIRSGQSLRVITECQKLASIGAQHQPAHAGHWNAHGHNSRRRVHGLYKPVIALGHPDYLAVWRDHNICSNISQLRRECDSFLGVIKDRDLGHVGIENRGLPSSRYDLCRSTGGDSLCRQHVLLRVHNVNH